MPLVLIYYLEINSICILINGIILFLYSKEKRGRAESPWYKGLVWSIILYCITDIIAIVFRGKPGEGARMILWIVNTIYVTLPVFLAILWGGYTDAKTRLFYKFGKKFVIAERIVYVIALILGIVSLTTPFTGFTFILNEENIYQRQTGTYLVPAVCYAMFAFYTVKMFIIGKKCESLEGRRCAKVLIIFDPKIFVMARSVEPSATDTILTTNSGIEVPNATTVKPMTKSDMPKRLAMAEAPSTRKSAPLTNATKPTIIKIIG